METRGHPVGRHRVLASKMWALAGVAIAISALMGCSRGSYPLDLFQEMHYQQSYKVQEPPNLSVPVDSVPRTGRDIDYTLEQAQQLEIPGEVRSDPTALERGARLFQVNCAVCHNTSGRGDGPMAERLVEAGYRGAYGDKPPPADLTAVGPTVGKPDWEVFLIITKGYTGVYPRLAQVFNVMPSFGKLLTEQERWTLVQYIRSLQQ